MGLLVTLVGLAALASVHFSRHPAVPIQELSPLETWFVWHQEIRPGIDHLPPWEKAYLSGTKTHKRWMGVAATVAGVGVVTMLTSLLIPARAPRRRKRR